jgi:hypothetical protein
MDFLKHREEGGMVFYQVFLLAPVECNNFTVETRNINRLREFEEICKRLRD